ncbi:hypothetical protein ZIOFF_013846 [Zingiber officinale]|uniref:Uncharacterized protein n=1 Tax=Zingiber officinale TaxID=94328 RepID=A0A8J5HC79_ZINOF|nr:hypothetical protein ZIOFF_013846 [Zingiber officinale]
MRASRFDTIQVISKEGSLRCLLELHGFRQQSMRASRFDTIPICPLERPKINHLLFLLKGGPDHIPGLCILTLCCLYFCRNSSQFVKPQPEQSKDYSGFKLERKEMLARIFCMFGDGFMYIHSVVVVLQFSIHGFLGLQKYMYIKEHRAAICIQGSNSFPRLGHYCPPIIVIELSSGWDIIDMLYWDTIGLLLSSPRPRDRIPFLGRDIIGLLVFLIIILLLAFWLSFSRLKDQTPFLGWDIIRLLYSWLSRYYPPVIVIELLFSAGTVLICPVGTLLDFWFFFMSLVLFQAYQPPIEPLLNELCLGIQADRLANKEDCETLVSRLIDRMMKSDRYGESRGVAFGLAGVAKDWYLLITLLLLAYNLYFEQDDPKVHVVVEQLLDVPNTPSEVISKEGSLGCLLELHGFWQQSMRASEFDTIQICPLERPKKWGVSPLVKLFSFPIKGGFAMELNVAQFWSNGIGSHEGGPDHHIPGLCIIFLKHSPSVAYIFAGGDIQFAKSYMTRFARRISKLFEKRHSRHFSSYYLNGHGIEPIEITAPGNL